jgi:prolyl oligopeptidase
MFDVMRSYSPLHNIRSDGVSPPQFVVVAERDFSAPPAQAYKYVGARQAALQAAGSDAPVLLRLLRGEGHTRWHHEVATRVTAEEIAFLYSFVNQN